MPFVDYSSDSEMSLFFCHPGLNPESSVFELDSCWSLPRTCYGAGITASECMQKSIRFTTLERRYFFESPLNFILKLFILRWR
jgi:hypothetical protein